MIYRKRRLLGTSFLKNWYKFAIAIISIKKFAKEGKIFNLNESFFNSWIVEENKSKNGSLRHFILVSGV